MYASAFDAKIATLPPLRHAAGAPVFALIYAQPLFIAEIFIFIFHAAFHFRLFFFTLFHAVTLPPHGYVISAAAPFFAMLLFHAARHALRRRYRALLRHAAAIAVAIIIFATLVFIYA